MAQKKTDIWMPIYIGDYLADTIGLSKSEHGSYFLAMMAYWRKRGPLTDKEAKSIMGEDFAAVSAFFDFEEGVWRHKRIDEELIIAERNNEQRTAAGKASAEKRWGKREGDEKVTSVTTSVITNRVTVGVTNPVTKPERKNTPSPSPSPSPSQLLGKNTSSAEPLRDSTPAFVEIPLNGGQVHSVTEADVEDYAKTFPAVDVRQQLREMRRWCLDHPNRRKTRRGVRGFITGWLGREQDKGPKQWGNNGAIQSGAAKPKSSIERKLTAIDRAFEEPDFFGPEHGEKSDGCSDATLP